MSQPCRTHTEPSRTNPPTAEDPSNQTVSPRAARSVSAFLLMDTDSWYTPPRSTMASPFDARATAAWTVPSGAERVPAALLSPDGATNQVLVSAPLDPGPDTSDLGGWFRPSATSPPSATLALSGMVTATARFAASPTTAFT